MKTFEEKLREQDERIEKDMALQHKLMKWGVILAVVAYFIHLIIS